MRFAPRLLPVLRWASVPIFLLTLLAGLQAADDHQVPPTPTVTTEVSEPDQAHGAEDHGHEVHDGDTHHHDHGGEHSGSHAGPMDHHARDHAHDGHDHDHDHHHSSTPPAWAVLPFVALLLAIAMGPLFFSHFWHHHYPKVSLGLALVTIIYYFVGVHHGYAHLVHVGFEYFSFIALLTGLFVAAGGIVINVDRKATPLVNLGILMFGAVIANLIGTTGAAMLLIRPFMKVNQGRLKPFHVVFFIFIVANVGGALTPIGDPPLFLGFLRGIDFFLFFELNILEWLQCLVMLGIVFFIIDSRCGPAAPVEGEALQPATGKISVKGAVNLIFILLVSAAVFLDPSKIPFLPALFDIAHGESYAFGIYGPTMAHLQETHPGAEIASFGFVREFIQLGVAFMAFKFAKKEYLEANGFNFEPIREVAFLFVGIFATMGPALAIIKAQAVSGSLFGLPLNPTTFYFGTGVLSGVLDNAPTFMSFLAGLEGQMGMTAKEMSEALVNGSINPEMYQQVIAGIEAQMATVKDPHQLAQLQNYLTMLQSEGGNATHLGTIGLDLAACAVASVFFGAMTYIGNGPNFMVKAIADNARDDKGDKIVEMPSFFGYIIRYSFPILFPVLIIIWVTHYGPWRIL